LILHCHVAEPLGASPRDPRYNATPLADAPNVNATVAWVATRSPIFVARQLKA